MNWTEGNLARHSKNKRWNDLRARQKQYFAKAHNNLLNSQVKQSPVAISAFGLGLGLGHKPPPLYQRKSKRPHYAETSSPVRSTKRAWGWDSGNDGRTSPGTVHEKKRKLLNTSDWAGLSLQQPIEITFPAQIQATIGSRWTKANRTHDRPLGRLRRFPQPDQAETISHSRIPPMSVHIGSQEIQPSVSSRHQSQSYGKRYSLAHPKQASLSEMQHPRISYPSPGKTRHLYDTCSERSQGLSSPLLKQPAHVPRNIPKATRGTPDKPAHVAYSSSSVIHEPAPLRADHFRVLQWSPTMSDSVRSQMEEIITSPERTSFAQDTSQLNSIGDHVEPKSGSNYSEEQEASLSNSDMDRSEGPQQEISAPLERGSSEQAAGQLPRLDDRPQPDNGRDSSEIQEAEVLTSAQDVYEGRQQSDEHGADVPKPKDQHQVTVQESKVPHDAQLAVDENETWMRFVFGDNDEELEGTIFREAAHQAAKELHPSDPCGTPEGLHDVTDTVGTCKNDRQISNGEIYDDGMPQETSSESHLATRGTISSDPVSSNLETLESMNLGSDVSTILKGTLGSDPSNAATAGSALPDSSEHQFRFAAPQTFVGKLADPKARMGQEPPPMMSPRRNDGKGKGKGRGRKKKRASDGRADIRRLPDFDGDPIEDFDGY
ncbi:hypothetical protein F4778DRAFT_778320 [Xylariomycetidae sp. FL2044]|nr:hypothetical protein F4778DRAFT_778320 [Xylariomycetidae sp. FL2044]